MRLYNGKTFADVYKASLADLIEAPEYSVSPRGMATNEITNVVHVVEDPYRCLYNNIRRGSQLKYIAGETVYYFSGRRDLSFIRRFASFWDELANDDATINSAYGSLIFGDANESGLTQWQWAVQSLMRDKDSRQAVMLFNRPRYQYYGNKDFICTLSGIFNIRQNKLHFTINMRSNDAILGTPADCVFFCLLQMQMLKVLRDNGYSQLELGTFTHWANSYHVYEKHVDLVREMIASQFESASVEQIREDFIDLEGRPTMSLRHLADAIEHGHSHYQTEDRLFAWLFRQTVAERA